MTEPAPEISVRESRHLTDQHTLLIDFDLVDDITLAQLREICARTVGWSDESAVTFEQYEFRLHTQISYVTHVHEDLPQRAAMTCGGDS